MGPSKAQYTFLNSFTTDGWVRINSKWNINTMCSCIVRGWLDTKYIYGKHMLIKRSQLGRLVLARGLPVKYAFRDTRKAIMKTRYKKVRK